MKFTPHPTSETSLQLINMMNRRGVLCTLACHHEDAACCWL